MKNIVLITFDSLRADHCGHHGYGRPVTPNLDTLYENGVGFQNATAVASRTNPSMAAAFTGEPMTFRGKVSDPEQSRYHLRRFGTLAEDLSDMGYKTGAFCPNAYASRYYGFDRGFDHFEDFLFSSDSYQTIFEEHLSDSSLYGLLRNLRNFVRREEVFRTWDRYVEDAIEWASETDDPYFLWLFSLDTHFPFLTPSRSRMYSSLLEQYYYNWLSNRIIDDPEPDLSEDTWQRIINIYDDAVSFGDELIAVLQESLSGDPVFLVHSDHGEAFGEHGPFGHFYPAVYEENVHVPMVAWSSSTESTTIESPFSLADIPEYILENATQDSLEDPPTRTAAISTDYDGRRSRNIVAARTASQKHVIQTDPDGLDERQYRLRAGERETRADPEDWDDTTERYAWRRFSHEDETLAVRRSVENLVRTGEI